jgi:hypothetical protein
VFRSGGVIVVDSGDNICVLVLSVCEGTLGTGGSSERARGVPVRRMPDVAACRALSRAEFTRVVVEDVHREDTEEVAGRDAGDWAGEVDAFVRW